MGFKDLSCHYRIGELLQRTCFLRTWLPWAGQFLPSRLGTELPVLIETLQVRVVVAAPLICRDFPVPTCTARAGTGGAGPHGYYGSGPKGGNHLYRKVPNPNPEC